MSSFERWTRFCEQLNFGQMYDPKQKAQNQSYLIQYMLNRTQSMFDWSGLPETIPIRSLELMLQTYGTVIFTKVNDDYYVFTGGLGGPPDVYYDPTIYIVQNPQLNLSKEFKIGEDCVLVRNDSMMVGLIPLSQRYQSQIVETELSINLAIINTRIQTILSADDDRTCESAKEYLKNVESGLIGVIGEGAFFDGLKQHPANGNVDSVKQLIEQLQYSKQCWLNDLGLNANFNMKREALNTAESALNDDALQPFIDNMLNERKQQAEKINEKYGLDITVSLNSSWRTNQQEIEKEVAGEENGIAYDDGATGEGESTQNFTKNGENNQ